MKPVMSLVPSKMVTQVMKRKMSPMVTLLKDNRRQRKLAMFIMSFCLVGCLMQAIFISLDYFSYSTKSSVAPIIPTDQKYPITSICIHTGASLLSPSNSTVSGMREKMAQIATSIYDCQFRQLKKDSLALSPCSEVFDVQVVSFDFKLHCVMVKPKIKVEFSFKQPIRSQYNRRMLYQFALNLPNDREIIPLAHLSEDPLDSYYFSTPLSADVHELFRLGYVEYNFQRLPYPYDTRCVKSKSSFSNLSSSLEFNKKLCSQILTTVAISFSNYYAESGTAFSLEVMSNPIFMINYSPQIEFGDFLIDLGSMIGVWLGASMLGTIDFVNLIKVRFINSPQLVYCPSLLHYTHLQAEKIYKRAANLKKISLEEERKSRKKLIHLIYTLIIIVFMFFQMISLITLYASYSTYFVTSYLASYNESVPKTIICIDLKRLLVINRTNNTEMEPTLENYNAYYTSFDNLIENFTLSQIYNETLSTDIIHHCSYRNGSSMMLLMDKVACKERFHVRKWYMAYNMCYTISPVNMSGFNNIKLLEYSKEPGILYSVSLEPIIGDRMDRLSFILSASFYPYISKDYMASIHLNSSINQTYLLTSKRTVSELLPYPYDTSCQNSVSGFSDCEPKCLVENGRKKIDRLPYSEIIDKSMDTQLLTYTDLVENFCLAREWLRIQSECRKLCQRQICHLGRGKTLVSHPFTSDWSLTLAVQNPTSPLLISEAQVRVTFADLIFQICCCFAFWVGLHGMSFVPVSQIISTRSALSYLISGKIQKIQSIFQKLHLDPPKPKPLITPTPCDAAPKRKFKQLAAKVLCIVGFAFHIYFPFQTYFSYPASIKTSRRTFPTNEIPSIYVCMDIFEIVRAWSPQETAELTKPQVMNLTISRLFKLTPTAHELIDTCGFRNLKVKNLPNYVSKLIYINGLQSNYCNREFAIRKQFTQDILCFELVPVNFKMTDIQKTATLGYPGYYYDFTLNSRIKLSSLFTFVAFNKTTITKRSFGVNIDQLINSSHSYEVSFIKFQEQCLEEPYSYPGYTAISSSICRRKCIRQHNQHTAELFVDDDTITRPFDASWDKESRKVAKKCQDTCQSFRVCETVNEYSVTKVNLASDLDTSESGIKFLVKETEYPATLVRFEPRINFSEFILTIGNIFAIWFGLSILDLNPIKEKGNQSKQTLTSEANYRQTINFLDRQLVNYEMNLMHQKTMGGWNLMRKKQPMES